MNAAINKDGDKVFFTWLDSQSQTDTAYDNPDVFARGYNLMTNELTNSNGLDQGTNVTGSSSISSSAWFADASYYVFSNTSGSYSIPIATETINGGNIIGNPVSFNYIPDFSFAQYQFTINAEGPPWGDVCWCWEGINENSLTPPSITITINPNPARE